MGRFRFWLVAAVVFSILLVTILRAQVSDEEKRKRAEFLKARETQSGSSTSAEESPSPGAKKAAKAKPKAHKSPSPTPEESPSAKKKTAKSKTSPKQEATPKPKPKPSETPEVRPSASVEPDATPKPKSLKKKTIAEKEATPKPKPKPSETPEAKRARTTDESNATPKPKVSKKKTTVGKEATAKKKKKGSKSKTAIKLKQTPEPEKTPSVTKAVSPRPGETPIARPTAPLPRAIAVPTAPPAPTAAFASTPTEEPEQLTIEKHGYEKPRGFWSRLFGDSGRSGSGAGYRYLTRSVRAEIDRAPADRRSPRWQMVVVHNSGTRQGNARVFDYYHRHVRHMQNGLAYHFVIGNGTSTGNGQIEVGDRWRRQINGGHVHSDYLNNIALGICLVGDFNRDQPTRAQLDCCEELIRYLRQRCGKIGSQYMVVKPHREANPPRWGTDCPGDAFPYSWFRRFRE